MNRIQSFTFLAVALAAAVAATGCAGMDRETRSTATGATIGGVAGAVLTHGSPAGVIGGAVVGGVIGHENDKKDR
jgi:osmotically inducible lipoprotein OsmB